MRKILFVLLAFVGAAAGAFLVTPNSPLRAPESSVAITDTSSETAKSFVRAARAQIGVVTEYSTAYFPRDAIPPQAGACADVVWRAMVAAGYDLPSLLAKDLRAHPEFYPASPAPDPNVDFRRVKTLRAFLDRFAQKLPPDVAPGNPENLAVWQAGDIVTFAASADTGGLEHIAIVSDARGHDGVPLIIHNYGFGTREEAHLLAWPTPITGHYRFFP
jgi:uncharacterized protein